jgi:hypothetical protein
MRPRSSLSLSAAVLLLLLLPASAFAGGSVGSSTVYPSADSNTAGQAESFRNTASASGSVDSLRVYLTPDNTASKVELGLYTDVSAKRRRGWGAA